MAIREERSLSAPTVFLDGRRLKIIPNSLTHDLPGEAKVRAVASGNTTEMVHGIDLEADVCTIAFELANTAEYRELALDYIARRKSGETSTVKIVEDGAQDVYDQCILTNKVNMPRDTEGKIKIELMGRYSAF